VVGHSFDAIVSRMLDGTVTSWNAGAERVFGYSVDEMLGHDIRALDREDPDDGFGRINERLRAGETVVRFEGSRVRKDGARLQVDVTVSPVHDADGVLTGAVVIMRDITQTRSLEHQLRQSQRLESLGRLSTGIAHDFNNALTVIRLRLGLLASQPDLARFKPRFDELQAATDHAAALTDQLVAFARQQQLEPRMVNLNDVITKLTSMVSPLLGASVGLTFSPQLDLHPVLADPVQMEQIFMNLAINARDAMPAGGELTIETMNVWLEAPFASEQLDLPSGWYALVTVTDTGIGMDAETVSHVFDPYFTTKPEGEGTGLGLATVYGIVHQSGGRVRVESEPGRGTTVRLYFPVGEDGSEPGLLEPPPAAMRSAEAVLIVDSNALIVSLVEEVLSGLGYETLVASDAPVALDLAARSPVPIALLVADISLPGMGGPQLAAALAESNPSLRVVYISGFSTIAENENGSLRVRGVLLRKPFTASQLLGALRDALETGDLAS
jgi:two-component system, cell cycle sensor histidine kinase and response regulator CckA